MLSKKTKKRNFVIFSRNEDYQIWKVKGSNLHFISGTSEPISDYREEQMGFLYIDQLNDRKEYEKKRDELIEARKIRNKVSFLRFMKINGYNSKFVTKTKFDKFIDRKEAEKFLEFL